VTLQAGNHAARSPTLDEALALPHSIRAKSSFEAVTA